MPEATKLTRCLRLIEALARHGPLGNQDIRRVLAVERRTAQRDVRSLEESGVPIVRTGVGSGRLYALAEGYRRSRLRLGLGDALALELGRQLLGFLGGTDLSRWMSDLSKGLGPALSPETADRLERVRGRLLYLSEPYRRYEAHDDVINELLSALLAERELSLDYRSTRGARAYRRFQPLGLVVYRRALYLLGRRPDARPAGRVWRLAVDRIRSAARTRAGFAYPRDFDLAQEVEGCFGIFQEGEPQQVVLRFAPRAAHLVRSRTWHSTQRLSDGPDGGVLLTMHTCGRELVRLVLEFGETVEVLAPPWLRDAVVGELRGALRLYDAQQESCP